MGIPIWNESLKSYKQDTVKSAELDIKGEPKDLIEVVIGDDKEPEIVLPQIKLQRWNNEVNMSFRYLGLTNYSVIEDNGKIILGGDKQEVHFYELPQSPELPEGGFEMEVILKEKPASNVLEYTINTKEFDFFYQPKLTQQEIDEGASRPENVVGSYAVYHKTKGGLTSSLGKDYKVGKAFHIYRPKIYDADDTWVWGELNIDVQTGTQTITIPQGFLDTAVYPVRHASGETFGFTSIGSTPAGIPAEYLVGSLYTEPTEDVTADSISMYIKSPSEVEEAAAKCAAYYGTDSGDGTKDILTDELTNFTITTAGSWHDFDFPGSTTLTYRASEDYWLLYFSDDGDGNYYYDTDSWPYVFLSATYPTWPASFSGQTGTGRKVSIYATYTPDAGTPEPNVNDTITITEDVTVTVNAPVTPSPNVNDDIAITEDVTVLINELFPSTSDDITITEDSTIRIQITAGVSETITITEDSTVVVNSPVILTPNVNDTITITEDVTVEVNTPLPPLKINIAGYTGVRVF